MSKATSTAMKKSAATVPAKLKASKAKTGVKEKTPMPSLEEDETEDDVASSSPQMSKKKLTIQKQHAGSDESSDCSSSFKSDESSSSESEEEEEGSYKHGGYHRVLVGDVFNNRFTVLAKLGWGHFSTVWRCRDAETGQEVAMKVQKSASHYMEAARDEVELLECVNEAAKKFGVSPRIVKLIASFEHIGPHGTHMCMVFEMLGDNLLTLIKRYDYKGIPIPLLKIMTKQMLEGMAFLHDQCKIIHTDLKPENVLLNKSLSKMPKFRSMVPPEYGGSAPVDSSTLTADEKKKLKRKLKRKKQKQNKKEVADALADKLDQSLLIDGDDKDDAVCRATKKPPKAAVDGQLLSNFHTFPTAPIQTNGSGTENPLSIGTTDDNAAMVGAGLHLYKTTSRASRDYPIPQEYAARIMLWLPPHEVTAQLGESYRRVYRFKLPLPEDVTTAFNSSRKSTCFSLKHFCSDRRDLPSKVEAALGGTDAATEADGSAAEPMGLWRLELDARYVRDVCALLESTWPGHLVFMNVAAAASYAVPGFYFPATDNTDPKARQVVLQGMYLRSTTVQDDAHGIRRVAPLADRVNSWHLNVLARHTASLIEGVPDYQVKIADLGNACWTYKRFTQDIQTRQYRSPEVILGQNYDQSTDMWSMGCFVFELATGELLFDPKSGKSFSRDEGMMHPPVMKH
ncbi:CMGC/SRPK protein kinase, variant [Aphanomyces invadans]|uniref:non-specific serine/threonine protein kinase n=1 Tax=Aphanomyces invadans TaxID=157072 RepID=A0A024USN0_9STRA|nr:CMGC/SRPK protein kinase, variant [Aphanomyces invadans]ETW09526.1 CMGC/SRPK protein kinase, variant [Aphanomyces invadans]|eukprot:XP_008860937.1 CMGC/SRPK protein kinase, variant [Aphanomyces invadans]